MSNIETGGPACPHTWQARDGSEIIAKGMTLRDYFAAKAMQALITSRHTDYENGWYAEDAVASTAYNMADAMMEAR